MKILFINPSSVDNLAEYDYSILNNLPADADIIYACSCYDQYIGKFHGNILIKPIFKYAKFHSNIFRGLSYCISLLILLGFIFVHRPNIVHTQWPKVLILDTIFCKIISKLNIPIVHTAHNILPHEDLTDSSFNVYRDYYRLMSGVIVHTHSSKEELITKFKISKNIIFINKHGLLKTDCDLNKRDTIKESLCKKYNLNNKIVFSSVGFQSYYKGLDFIIDYWKEFGQYNSKIHLIIAGVNRYDRIAELNSIPNVTIIDRLLSQEEISAVIVLSDVLLLPYIKISQSGVLMSAIHECIPVLVTNVGGLPEPLQISNIGWNIGQPSFINFQTGMDYIISHFEQIDNIKNDIQSWHRLQEAYSWKKIAERTYEIYSQIIK